MSQTVNVTLGGENISVVIDGGNMGAGASVGLQELNQAVGEAKQAADDAEASANQAAQAVAGVPAIATAAGTAAGASAGAAAGTASGAAAGEVAALAVVETRLLKVESLSDLRDVVDTEAAVFARGRASVGDGYEGTFEWVAGDQSANVTADPAQGVWVAPDGQDGSGGAWKRVFSGPVAPLWFGAVGDNVTDDGPALVAARAFAVSAGLLVDLGGKTYLTDQADPFGGSVGTDLTMYRNGTIWRSGQHWVFDTLGGFYRDNVFDWQNGISEYGMFRAAGGMPATDGWTRGSIAIGLGALDKAESGIGSIAIGTNVMSRVEGEVPFHNIGIGESSLTYLSNQGSGQYDGTRNVALGSLAGHFITTGYMNTLVGRDAGHNLVAGYENSVLGYQALGGGLSPIGWSGGIEMQFGGGGNQNSALGALALRRTTGTNNVGVGYGALQNLKGGGRNIGIGMNAGAAMDSDTLWGGWQGAIGLSIAGTYATDGTTVTATMSSAPSVGYDVGDTIGLGVSSGPLAVEQGKAVLLSVSGNVITFADPKGVAGSGNCTLRVIQKTTKRPTRETSDNNVIIGGNAALNRRILTENIVIGDSAAQGVTATGDALMSGSTVIGVRAARDVAAMTNCVFLGINAGRWAASGAVATGAYTNVTVLGHDSRVSGDNQVQLGNSSTTTYVYGTVQNRSDARDKADIRDTTLGLDFIKALRPVDYRWDMREDYIEADEETGEVTVHDKDGSKKRARFHHGFVAQEVQQLINDGVIEDFGGFQDHSVNGGCDVQSIGYDEIIAPLVKAVQQLAARVARLEGEE